MYLLFLPVAGRRVNDSVILPEGMYWMLESSAIGKGYAIRLTDKYFSCKHDADFVDRQRGNSIRLACVVSEDLTEDVSSVPSCCG